MMRIITGKARGVRLSAPEGEATRPTSERAKEAVFSMLQFEIAGANVLDLFAGTGQLGLEALSRGAAYAVFCDASRDAAEIIRGNIRKTGMEAVSALYCGDYRATLRKISRTRRFRLIFLDPPYALGAIPEALRMLLDHGCIEQGGKVICESSAPEDVFGGDAQLAERFEILRSTRYGAAAVTVLQKNDSGEAEP